MSKDLEQREKEFQDAMKKWDSTKEKKYWDIMFLRVMDVCHNIAAKKLVGVRIDPEEFENRWMNAAMYVMSDIQKGRRPEKLSSYCYLRVFKFLYNPSDKQYDKMSSIDITDPDNEFLFKDYQQSL